MRASLVVGIWPATSADLRPLKAFPFSTPAYQPRWRAKPNQRQALIAIRKNISANAVRYAVDWRLNSWLVNYDGLRRWLCGLKRLSCSLKRLAHDLEGISNLRRSHSPPLLIVNISLLRKPNFSVPLFYQFRNISLRLAPIKYKIQILFKDAGRTDYFLVIPLYASLYAAILSTWIGITGSSWDRTGRELVENSLSLCLMLSIRAKRGLPTEQDVRENKMKRRAKAVFIHHPAIPSLNGGILSLYTNSCQAGFLLSSLALRVKV
jgi:hypothetical protein